MPDLLSKDFPFPSTWSNAPATPIHLVFSRGRRKLRTSSRPSLAEY